MANQRYALARQGCGEAKFNWVSDDMRMILLTSAYVPNLNTDQFLSDITAGIVSSFVALTGKTNNRGLLGADNPNFNGVPSMDLVSQGVVLKYDSGTPANSLLFAYWNVATGLILTTTGGLITANWAAGTVCQI